MNQAHTYLFVIFNFNFTGRLYLLQYFGSQGSPIQLCHLCCLPAGDSRRLGRNTCLAFRLSSCPTGLTHFNRPGNNRIPRDAIVD